MNINARTRQLVLGVVLTAFAVQTGLVYFQEGLSWVAPYFSMQAGVTIFTDLVIALSLAIAWMLVDARERGVNPWGYVVLTLFTGSIGPLLYLIRRESPDAVEMRAQAVRS